MRVRLTAAGPADPGLVWDRYDDLDRWAVWAPQIRRVDAPSRRLAPGLTGTVHPVLGPGVRFTVHEVDPVARVWSWQAGLGPIVLHLAHGVEGHGVEGHGVKGHGVEGTGARTWLEVRGPAPFVLAYAPLARYALARLVRA